MTKFRLTTEAVNDLSAIWNYSYDTWSEKQADKYYQLLMNACNDIALNPKLGKDYADIYPNLKGQKTSKHIIFYRELNNETIEIVRILYERMDLYNQLVK